MEDLLKAKIDHKFVLLDTGIIIRAYEYYDQFEKLFKDLKEVNCVPVYFPFIEFEFTRGAYEDNHRELRKEFLKGITESLMPNPSSETIEDAIKIANSYSARKLHSASLVDCCIAAYLKKHADNLFLVTLNHKDFPTFLFDRIGIYPIDTEKDVFSLAFYRYNLVKATAIGIG